MKTTTLIFSISLLALPAGALDSRFTSTAETTACTVRLSNYRIERQFSSGNAEKGFCSGTLIAPDLLVTAAHCLNEAISGQVRDLADVGNNVNVNMAVRTAVSSEIHTFLEGDSVVYADSMRTHRQRQSFISEGDVSRIHADIVILKLEEPVEDFDEASCPRLPTAEDCAEFTRSSAAALQAGAIGASFYSTGTYESGQGAAKRVYTYPTNRAVQVNATVLSSGSQGQLAVQFNTESEDAKLTKGDSGTGLLWSRSGGRKILIGVQSAASARNANRGFFAISCGLRDRPNWPGAPVSESPEGVDEEAPESPE